MQEENEKLFSEEEQETKEQPKEETTQQEDLFGESEETDFEDTPEGFGDDYDFGDVSDNIKLEVELKEEDKDKEFIIENAEILKPYTRDVEGNFIEPKLFNPKKTDSKKGYQTKVKITYKDSNYISLIPNVKWFIGGVSKDTGKKTLNPWFVTQIDEKKLSDQFTPAISKVYYRFCVAYGYEPGKLSAQQFIKELPGKKVKLTQWETEYEGETRQRLDIKEFV